MRPLLLPSLFLLAALALLAGCPPSGEACDEEGETRCEDELVATCADGVWGEAVDCGMGACMEMATGMQHCM